MKPSAYRQDRAVNYDSSTVRLSTTDTPFLCRSNEFSIFNFSFNDWRYSMWFVSLSFSLTHSASFWPDCLRSSMYSQAFASMQPLLWNEFFQLWFKVGVCTLTCTLLLLSRAEQSGMILLSFRIQLLILSRLLLSTSLWVARRRSSR